MRTRAALRRAPLLLEQPTDLVHACLMFLDLEEMRAAKSVCHAFCKAARFWLNDVRWLGKHISLHRIHEVARGYLSESEVLQVARRNSGLTTAQFDECFLSHESSTSVSSLTRASTTPRTSTSSPACWLLL